MKTHFLSHALLIGALILAGVSPLPADGADFRIRIPNPIPHISKKMEKVGDLFFRAARRLEGAEEEEDLRRDAPLRTYPGQPSQPHRGDLRAPTLLPDDSRRRVDGQGLTQPYDRQRGLTSQQRPLLQPQRIPLYSEVPVQPSGAAPLSIPYDSSSRLIQTPDPRGAVKSPETASRFTPPATPANPASEVITPAPPPEVKPTPRSKYLYGRLVPNRPGLVYPPGVEQIPVNMVDVRGITPGTKVRAPATGEIFLVP